MKKIIKEVIVVEGKDDVSAVKAAVDAELIITNGFAIRKKGNIEKLRKAYENQGLIVLTDPDFVGKELRRYIQKYFPNVKHAYITRSAGTKDGDIGIENACPKVIIEALEKAKCETIENKENLFTMDLLLDYGLIGNNNSKEIREKFCGLLGIGYGNGKQLLGKLNRYGITMEEFEKAIKNTYEN